MIEFDEHGFALDEGMVLAWVINPHTRELLGQEEVWVSVGTGLPAGSYLDNPPVPSEGKAIIRMDSGWEEVNDYRGQMAYHTSQKRPQLVDFIGDLPSDWTLQVPGPYDTWQDGQWVKDQGAEEASLSAAHDAKKAELMAEVNSLIAIATDATDPDIMGEDILPEDIQRLKDLKVYRVALSRVTFPSDTWPVLPE